MQRIQLTIGAAVLTSIGATLLLTPVPKRHRRPEVRPINQAQSGREALSHSGPAVCMYPDGLILNIEKRLEPIKVVKPQYPEEAKRLGIEGLVQVGALLDQNGDVVWACGRGNPALTASAEAAARECKFPKNFGYAKPGFSGRTPVELIFDFRLNDQEGERIEEFTWRYGAKIIGRLNVPSGFKAETYDYSEGIVTRLRYYDGSKITLQAGGMFRIPLFQAPEYDLISLAESPAKTVRTGRSSNDVYWREDNYKRRKITGKRISMSALFPPNLGYSGVPAPRRAEFDRALDSFVPEIDER